MDATDNAPTAIITPLTLLKFLNSCLPKKFVLFASMKAF